MEKEIRANIDKKSGGVPGNRTRWNEGASDTLWHETERKLQAAGIQKEKVFDDYIPYSKK